MKMKQENDTNRVGIYTQVSAEATAAGEGLALKREKSPVATTQSNENLNENENRSKEEKKGKPITVNADDSETANTSLPEDSKLEEEEEGQGDRPLGDDQDQGGGGSITGNDCHSNYSSGRNSRNDGSSKWKQGNRGYERHQANAATKLKEFPRSERHFGKERWYKALSTLQNIGFVNWEINTMLEALDNLAERRDLDEAISKQSSKKRQMSELQSEESIKIPRLEDNKLAAIKRKDPGVISGILTPSTRFPKYESPVTPADKEEENLSKLDLRVNIGDASHPHFHILPEHRNLLQNELHLFVIREINTYDIPISILNSSYINQTLLVECQNVQTIEFLKTRLSELNGLWPGAKLELHQRIGVRQKVQIFIPYVGLETKEILEIIKNQNKLNTDEWIVEKREDLDDGICLDVEVDESMDLQILTDQDDLFFLLTRATVKMPVADGEET